MDVLRRNDNRRRILALLLNLVALHIQLLSLTHHRLFSRPRRWWVRPINRHRREQGHYHNFFTYIKQHDHEEFFAYTRMSAQNFDQLLKLVTPHLVKNSIRKPLPVGLRLAFTVSYLAHGNGIRSQSWDYRIGRSTAYKIIPEVCEAIWKALQPVFLPTMNRRRWEEVAQGFQEKWQFPNCVGAIAGKHVKIQAPSSSGSQYFCYKKYFSLVLMASCDHNYRFTWVDVGQYGSISDAGVWSRSDFGSAFETGQVDLPPPVNLPDTNIAMHHMLIGDEAFPLRHNIMRPYSQRDLGDAERIFNYRLSRARRVIENAFCILVSRWRILASTICSSSESAGRMVIAMVCLHNFIMAGEDDVIPHARVYCPPEMVDQEGDNYDIVGGQWRRLAGAHILEDIGRMGANNAPRSATVQRNLLRDYFISPVGEAQAPWQYARAFRGLNINPPA